MLSKYILHAMLSYFIALQCYIAMSSDPELSHFDPDKVSSLVTSPPQDYGQLQLRPIHSSTPHRRYISYIIYMMHGIGYVLRTPSVSIIILRL